MPSLQDSKNYKLWQHFCEPFPSPNRFIDAGWLFMIGAALQRRVWIGSDLMSTYPNCYTLFVAEPGVGKSLITSSIKKVFMKQTMGHAGGNAKSDSQSLLYPISADSTSFEAFVNFTASNKQSFRKPPAPNAEPRLDEKGNPIPPRPETYYHCSPTFILDEAASIFDKDAGKMAVFLLEGWTCTERYERNTIGRGSDTITNVCLNLIGGIQPGKLVELSRTSILDNGFSRRCLIVYGEKNRFRTDQIEHSDSQVAAFDAVCKHVRTLGKLYGKLNQTPEAKAWMRQKFVIDEPVITNRSEYLKYYFPTKQQHTTKLAMAMHFSDSTDMTIGVEPFMAAYDYLTELEQDMHMAYVGAADERGKLLNRIKHILRGGSADGLSADELYPDLIDLVDYDNLLPALRDLVKAGELIQTRENNYVNLR